MDGGDLVLMAVAAIWWRLLVRPGESWWCVQHKLGGVYSWAVGSGAIADGSLCNGYIFIKGSRIRNNTVHIKVFILKGILHPKMTI